MPFLGGQAGGPLPRDAAIVGLAGLFFVGVFYTWHSIWVSAEMYSAPSIVMQTRGHDGSLHIFDDFREGYAWLRYNTPDDAVVGSWCGSHIVYELFKLQCKKCQFCQLACHGAVSQGDPDFVQAVMRSCVCTSCA